MVARREKEAEGERNAFNHLSMVVPFFVVCVVVAHFFHFVAADAVAAWNIKLFFSTVPLLYLHRNVEQNGKKEREKELCRCVCVKCNWMLYFACNACNRFLSCSHVSLEPTVEWKMHSSIIRLWVFRSRLPVSAYPWPTNVDATLCVPSQLIPVHFIVHLQIYNCSHACVCIQINMLPSRMSVSCRVCIVHCAINRFNSKAYNFCFYRFNHFCSIWHSENLKCNAVRVFVISIWCTVSATGYR